MPMEAEKLTQQFYLSMKRCFQTAGSQSHLPSSVGWRQTHPILEAVSKAEGTCGCEQKYWGCKDICRRVLLMSLCL